MCHCMNTCTYHTSLTTFNNSIPLDDNCSDNSVYCYHQLILNDNGLIKGYYVNSNNNKHFLYVYNIMSKNLLLLVF